MSWAVIRTLSPERSTEPSTTASTFSSRPFAGGASPRIRVALESLQVGDQVGGVLVTHIAVLLERLVDNRLELRRDFGIQPYRRRRRLVENCAEDDRGSAAAERLAPRGHL